MESSESKTKSKAKPAVRSKKPAVAAVKAPTRKAKTKTSLPDDNEIRLKAQQLYNERVFRGEHGTAEDDWLRAEKMLRG